MSFQELIDQAVKNMTPPTRYRLAKTLGITPTSVYEWEAGRSKPNGEHVLKLIEIGKKKKQRGLAAIALLATLAAASALPAL